MIDTDIFQKSGRGFGWLALIVAVAVAAAVVVAMGQTVGDDEESPVYVEEFRVAEPLRDDTEAVIRDQLETITAVTEPYDEVEAAVDDQPEEVASNQADLQRQCATVLKEMAFCTNNDQFLDIIGAASNLRTGDQRQRFMELVQDWFEPGGAREYCESLYEHDDVDEGTDDVMWMQASEATDEVCPDFGQVLMDVDAFQTLDVLWR